MAADVEGKVRFMIQIDDSTVDEQSSGQKPRPAATDHLSFLKTSHRERFME